MLKANPGLSAATQIRRPEPLSLGKDNLLSRIEAIVGPAALVGSLWAVAYYFDEGISPPHLILSVIAFALAFPSSARLQTSRTELVLDITLNWMLIAGLLVLTGWGTGYLREFSIEFVSAWLWVAPLTELLGCFALRSAAPYLVQLQGPPRRAIIVGINEQGLALAGKINHSPLNHIELAGFVDSRENQRIESTQDCPVLGKLDQLADLVKTNRVQLIYLSLPMASQPRILQILDELKDTTASIYFVPDMFVTDLVQGRPGSVCGMPVIAVCDTPFTGSNGIVKRTSDIVLSILILALILPILCIIAIAVKCGSPGPIIFKQRRYGLDGEEIMVYKFRSMTVTEDGNSIQQATKNDARITPLGAFLRRTSLDELPQFVNVLQGRMSIVGPRPHAVAHNEMYRKLIKGYMVRHKVKPGITGWAQVNGFRGETETLEKMQGRIDFDLDYLRNWSLRLDLHIIAKTIRLVLKDQQAY
ncbi:MAG: undecaprenyl-phosphate glucose phosphotransferase [Burkholderiales bacterium]|nr:undecaprenyl-phosphate glucose phosphotransferase [Burkholderiales bacterium]